MRNNKERKGKKGTKKEFITVVIISVPDVSIRASLSTVSFIGRLLDGSTG
jgi:hypothetical protein